MMRLRYIEPHPRLKDYIGKIWVFESSGRIPDEDLKLIVPNGMAKLVIPFRNGLTGKYSDWYHVSMESSITLIGCADAPAIVDSEEDKPSGTVGFEFTPLGAYRFFRLRHSEIRNRIHPLTDVFGKEVKPLHERVAETRDPVNLTRLVQSFLIAQLQKSKEDQILDYCLKKITFAKGIVSVMQLEKETGYSSRWIYEKFMEKVGVSPKTLSSITRFMQIYHRWALNGNDPSVRETIYDFFYDQPHFIREFKRFTGLSPTRFASSENEFGRIFYKG